MTNRQLKVAKQIQKDLSTIFQQKGMAYFHGALVTVSEVRVTPDLSMAKIFLSAFPFNKTEIVLKTVQEDTKTIRGELGRLVRHQLRLVPELEFRSDETMEKLSEIDKLLSQ